MLDKKYYYSEIFHSIQGEGLYTGVNTLWLRFFLCNLQCNGFGQKDPTDESSYELPFEEFDVSTVKKVEDLPVWSKGCDSSYTWSKKFKHLMGQGTPEELCLKIMEYAKSDSNPKGLFEHPVSGQTMDLCFTGGEPLMKHAQECSVEMMKYFDTISNIPRSVTYETNGTQPLTQEFKEYWNGADCELFFSVSPKLFTVSGEKAYKAIKPDVVLDYYKMCGGYCPGQMKFVLGTEDRQWDEMKSVLAQFRSEGIDWPVYIMPCGAREQEQYDIAGKVAERAIKEGYNVSARVHVYLWGNKIGT